MSLVCSRFRRAIEESPPLRKRAFLEENPEHVGLNTFLLRPGRSWQNRSTFWYGVPWLIAARGSRCQEMLLCQPPATAIDVFFYDRRQCRAQNPGRVKIQVCNVAAIRLKDIIAALDGRLPDFTLTTPQISIPEGIASTREAGLGSDRIGDAHAGCRTPVDELKLRCETLQTSLEALRAEFRAWTLAK
ncbi:hypothetical protein LTR17_014488 [Elasticomyces elasticus]|nr:hypothetical protein LTR17_014488 [Elasticomyces elasticus]